MESAAEVDRGTAAIKEQYAYKYICVLIMIILITIFKQLSNTQTSAFSQVPHHQREVPCVSGDGPARSEERRGGARLRRTGAEEDPTGQRWSAGGARQEREEEEDERTE